MPVHRTSQPASIVIGHRKSEQLHHFNDGDEVIVVRTTLQPNGEYTAIDHENYDYDSPVGWGFSTIGAIADLFEKMPRANSEREERADRQAQAFDHAQDHRKNYEAIE
jgi:hypothetical protein